MARTRLIIMSLTICAGPAHGSPLLSDLEVLSWPSVWAAQTNPAHAARLNRATIEARTTPLSYHWLQMTYPAAPTIKKAAFAPKLDDTDLIAGTPVGERCGLTFNGKPPIGQVSYSMGAVPLVLLSQQINVAATGKLQSNYTLNGSFGCLLSPRFSIGAGAMFNSLDLAIGMTPEGWDHELGKVTLHKRRLEIRTGLVAVPQPGVVLGLALMAARWDRNGTEITLPGIIEPGENHVKRQRWRVTPRIAAGAAVSWRSLRTIAELAYAPADKGETFSLVDFRSKPLDSYPTLEARAALLAAVGENWHAHTSFSWVPAKLGPGERGPGTRTGVTSLQAAEYYTGSQRVRPYWKSSLGGAFRSRPGRNETGFRIGAAIVVSSGNLGVGPEGEQPATYDELQVGLPMELGLTF